MNAAWTPFSLESAALMEPWIPVVLKMRPFIRRRSASSCLQVVFLPPAFPLPEALSHQGVQLSFDPRRVLADVAGYLLR